MKASINKNTFVSLAHILIISLLIVIPNSYSLLAQNVGINGSGASAHPSAILDLDDASGGNNKGLLIPRIPLQAINIASPVTSPANSLLVYNTATASSGTTAVTPGYYFWNGLKWDRFISGPSTDWSITGNIGLNSSINFLGTLDDQNLIFKRNNIQSGLLSAFNTSYGVSALNPVTTGTNNSSFGQNALFSNTTGNNNNAFGQNALFSNTTGFNNVAVGPGSLYFNTTGDNNSAIGNIALFNNTSGVYNIAMGTAALFNNTTGGFNCAFGLNSLLYNTTGNFNIAMGLNSLRENLTGVDNIGLGTQALATNSTGSLNVSIGPHSMQLNTNGASNVATGNFALYSNTTGNSNVVSGPYSSYQNTSGSLNTVLGSYALFSVVTGSNNVALGANAGLGQSGGDNNIIIGANATVPNVWGSNQVRIGDANITYAGVQIAWTITSDKKWKDNIRPLPYGLNLITKLKPVDYTRINSGNSSREIGFIAQEVEQALKDVGYTEQGLLSKDSDGALGIRYNDFIPLLTKAIQEQQLKIEQMEKKINLLEQAIK